jgi:hypothetical protein
MSSGKSNAFESLNPIMFFHPDLKVGLMEGQDWLTLAGMHDSPTTASAHALKILPAYTVLNTIEEVLQVARARRLLWLEILFNDQLNFKLWQDHPEVQEAFGKACRWFTTYRSLIQSVLPRLPLPVDTGKIDQRDYRRFAAALQFLAASSPPPKSISE